MMARNLEREKPARGKDSVIKSKLSRKISELTMVVHLLFTRNHEREVEIGAWKTVYENELSDLQKNLDGKISWLEGQLNELEKFKVLYDLKTVECEKLRQQIVQIQDNERILTNELEEKSQLMVVAKNEIADLKERLNGQSGTMTSEIEQLKKENYALNENLSVKLQKIKKCQTQNKEKQAKIEELELELKKNEELKRDSHIGYNVDWQLKIEQLNKTVIELSNSKEESEFLIAKLELKNKQLNQKKEELTNQVKELENQLQQTIKEHNRQRKETRPHPDVPKNTPIYDKDEEIERLRREIRRYRLELSNRESNFNRMFSEHQPVLVESGRNRSISTPQVYGGFPNLTGARKKSMTPPHFPVLGDKRSSTAAPLSPRQFHGF